MTTSPVIQSPSCETAHLVKVTRCGLILAVAALAACGGGGRVTGGEDPGTPDLDTDSVGDDAGGDTSNDMGAIAAMDLSVSVDLAYGPDQACADAVAALCKRLDECASGLIKLQYGDVATCRTRLVIGCKASFSLPGTSASPARAAACAAMVPNVSCDDYAGGKLPAECSVVPGMLANGAACAEDAQCNSAKCVHPVGGGCGTCGTAPKAGESCAKFACGDGLVCGPGNAVCAPYGRLGDNCDGDHPCLPSLSCKGSNKMGTCIKPLALNAGCDPLAAEYCGCAIANGEYCAPGSKTCQPLTFAKAGAACGLVNNSFVVCAASGHCTATNIFIPGTCLKFAADGAACDPTNGPDCQPPARCSGGVCRITDPTTCK